MYWDIRARLKTIRLNLNWSQSQMAEAFSINVRTYQRYETGEREIPATVFQTLSAMGYNMEWLVSGEGPMKKSDIEEIETYKRINELEKECHELRSTLKKIRAEIEAVGEESPRRAGRDDISKGLDPA